MTTAAPTLPSKMITGIFVGGSLGALGAWMAFGSMTEADESETSDANDPLRGQAIALLKDYPNILRDSNMYVALQEPIPLFLQVDARTAKHLLASLDLLVSTVVKVKEGSTKPAEVATAIRARREASNRLLALTRKARQTKPLLASELEEDLQTLKKCMEGHIHNIMQQSNLNIMETCCSE